MYILICNIITYSFALRDKNRLKKSSKKQKFGNHKHKYRKNNGVSSKNISKRITRSSSQAAATRPDRKKLKVFVETARKYRTRSRSLKRVSESSASNNSLDVPSTSTGITGTSASVYRIIEQDSDDEAPVALNNCIENRNTSESNFINIIPTPLNGSHDMFINMMEMATESTSDNGNMVTLRNDDYEASASTSNNCVVPSAHVDSDEEYNFENYLNTYLNDSSCGDSGPECETTPVKRKRVSNEVDSGFATGSCSSNGRARRRVLLSRNVSSSTTTTTTSGGTANGNTYNDYSSDDDCRYEKFRRRVKKARINIRKQIGGDSESNWSLTWLTSK